MSTDPAAANAADDPSRRYQTYGPVGATEAVWSASTIALLDRLLGLDSFDASVPDDQAHAPTRKHAGLCRVCGDRFSMSFEHFPPETMGNNATVRRAPAHAALESEDPLAFPRNASYQIQRGSGARVLCASCNSHSGTNFVPAMAAFARVIQAQVDARVAAVGHAPGILDLSLDEWELGDIARAGLVAVMAQGVHDHLLRVYPKLTEIVLHGATGLPADVRLGLTYIAAGRVRATPPHAASSIRGEVVFMETSAPPLAWTLSFLGESRVPLDRTADVSSWLDTPPGTLAPTSILHLPVGAVDSPLAGDFRPAPLIRAEMSSFGDS